MSPRFDANPKNTELVASAGRWGLYRSTISFNRETEIEVGLVTFTHQNLLTSGGREDYINLKVAQEKSGLSPRMLIELCRTGKIDARKSNGKWEISLSSLIEYISR